jgi:hypothetical protein
LADAGFGLVGFGVAATAAGFEGPLATGVVVPETCAEGTALTAVDLASPTFALATKTSQATAPLSLRRANEFSGPLAASNRFTETSACPMGAGPPTSDQFSAWIRTGREWSPWQSKYNGIDCSDKVAGGSFLNGSVDQMRSNALASEGLCANNMRNGIGALKPLFSTLLIPKLSLILPWALMLSS